MTRALLLAVAVLTVAAACTSGHPPAPNPPPATTGPPSGPGTSPTSRPTGITSQEAAQIVPLAPARLTARLDAHDVRLEWPATGEDVAYYRCLRRPTGMDRWTTIGQATSTDLSYVDRSPANGTYVYGVQAVNAYGVASATTQSQLVTVH